MYLYTPGVARYPADILMDILPDGTGNLVHVVRNTAVNLVLLREGPCSQSASCVVCCGSGVYKPIHTALRIFKCVWGPATQVASQIRAVGKHIIPQ
jgi:hypothetical protein